MTNLIIAVMAILSMAFMGLLTVGMITYIRRTWQQIRAHEEEPLQERILDGLDQLQTQLYLVGERLDRLESRLPPGEEDPNLPPAHGED